MKLHDDYYEEEHSSGSKITYVYMLLIMSVVILGVTALVFWANQSKNKSDGSGYAVEIKIHPSRIKIMVLLQIRRQVRR